MTVHRPTYLFIAAADQKKVPRTSKLTDESIGRQGFS